MGDPRVYFGCAQLIDNDRFEQLIRRFLMTNLEKENDTGNRSMWATGGVVFAATMLVMVGVFQFFEGLAAIINDEFYVALPNYAYELDVSGWGWIHLIIGVLVALTGFFLFSGSAVAGGVAIGLAGLAAISNFFFIPYYPIWSLLIIAMAVFVIWAIASSGINKSSE